MAKSTCESSRALSIFWLKKHQYLQDWASGSIHWTSNWGKSSVGISVNITSYPQINFDYTIHRDEGDEDMKYSINLVTTHCALGGKRYWFICPLTTNGIDCGRRVGVLYLAGKWFGCRKCHNLAYMSQQETHTGYFGALRCIFDDSAEKESKMRVKYWNGRPTKRYERLLRKMGRRPSLEAMNVMEKAMRARMGIK